MWVMDSVIVLYDVKFYAFDFDNHIVVIYDKTLILWKYPQVFKGKKTIYFQIVQKL